MSTGKMELNIEDWLFALKAVVAGVVMPGKAELADKIMVDVLSPAVDSLKQSMDDYLSISQAIQLSAEAAQQGMVDTIPWIARKGRASYLGERSPGHQDPGATSSYMILHAAADTWADS